MHFSPSIYNILLLQLNKKLQLNSGLYLNAHNISKYQNFRFILFIIIQGVTEKNAFILTGNRTHLLQQLF
jgi:hypothetical protein